MGQDRDILDGFLGEKLLAVLQVFAENPGRKFYAQEIVRTSRGRVKPGSVYAYLEQLEEAGLVEYEPEKRPTPGPKRWLYGLTGFGERALRVHESAKAMVRAVLQEGKAS